MTTETWHGGPAKARIVKVVDDTLRDLEWQLWIPPIDMECYAGDTVESDLIGMWGDTYWPSHKAACSAFEMHLNALPGWHAYNRVFGAK